MPTVITKTIKPDGGGDFTTTTAFVAAIPSDMVAVDEQWIGECYQGVSNLVDSVYIGPHTTDATRNIIIRAAAGHENKGVRSGGFGVETTTGVYVFKIECNNVLIENIRAVSKKSSSNHSVWCFDARSTHYPITVKNCIADRNGSNKGIMFEVAGGNNQVQATNKKVINCMSFDGGYAYNLYNPGSVYGSIAINASQIGLRGRSANFSKIVNSVGFNCGSNYFKTSGNNVFEYNATSDGTAVGVGAITNITSSEFVDSANDNYSLASGSQLIDAGGNYPADYTDDITGSSRDSTYDIGAFEFVSGGGGGVSGDLSSLELNDSFNASGAADTAGNLATSELSTDLLNSTGFIANSGSLSVSETGTDSFLADANVIISGDVVVNEPVTDTALITGSNSVLGGLSITENSTDLLSSVGKLLINGSFGATELNSDSFLITGNILIEGGFSTTEQSTDSLLSNGSAATLGTLNVSESNNDSLSAAGTVITNGNVDVIENSSDVFVSSGENKIQGVFLSTETGLDLFQINGVIATGGQVNITETETDLFAAGIIQLQAVNFKNAIFVNSVNTTFYNR